MNINDYSILLVEDESDQVLHVQETLSRANLVNPLRVVDDGEKAIAYLSGEGASADRKQCPLPSLVLLDLTLPRISGIDVLKWIRSQPGLKSLPVILLTSPDDGSDLASSQDLGANSCMLKPLQAEGVLAMMRSLDVYWMLLDQTSGAHSSDAPQAGSANLRRVLVVDPDADFLHAITEALRRRTPALAVTVASTAAEAMEQVVRHAPDAVAYDPAIEAGDDSSLLSRIHATNKDLPVLILCEDRDDPAAVRALQRGAWGILVKQIRQDRFADQLHDAFLLAWTPLPEPVRVAECAAPEEKLRVGRSQDTDIMGRRIEFQETAWDLVGTARTATSLDALIRVYWKPLYFFVRQQGCDNETAKDVVQDFLLSALEHDTILKADRGRGRFRTFLLAAIGNFLKDRYRSSSRRKRGGGRIPLSLDGEGFQPDHLRVEDTRGRPEAVVDRAWAKDVLQQCISELQGKPSHLQAFELNMNGMEYDRISKETGLGESAAKTAVHRLRRKLRDIIRGHLSGPTATEEEITAQIDEFSSLLR